MLFAITSIFLGDQKVQKELPVAVKETRWSAKEEYQHSRLYEGRAFCRQIKSCLFGVIAGLATVCFIALDENISLRVYVCENTTFILQVEITKLLQLPRNAGETEATTTVSQEEIT